MVKWARRQAGNPRRGTSPASPHPSTHPTDDLKTVQRHERALVLLQNDKKPHQLPKGHQCIVYNMTVNHIQLTHKEK